MDGVRTSERVQVVGLASGLVDGGARRMRGRGCAGAACAEVVPCNSVDAGKGVVTKSSVVVDYIIRWLVT